VTSQREISTSLAEQLPVTIWPYEQARPFMITCGRPGLVPAGAGAWACQARFVYEDDGLDAVAESELARMRFKWVLTVDSSTNRLAAISGISTDGLRNGR
jgi:hypothetical protein